MLMSGGITLLLAVTVLVAVAIAAGAAVLMGRRFARASAATHVVQAAASGVFLGAGLVHMLPDAASRFDAAGQRYPWAFVICGAAFLLLAALEAITQGDDATEQGEALPLLAALMLGVHSLLAGAALGATTHTAALLLVFIALIAHKSAAALSLALMLRRSRLGRAAAWAVFLGFVACLPAGAIFGRLASFGARAHPAVPGAVLALAAGTFLFLGVSHGLATDGLRFRRLEASASGFALMALVAAVI